MHIVKIPENRVAETLQNFIMSSAFTFEGIDIDSKKGKESLNDLEKLLRETGYTEKDCVGYRVTGKIMNEYFQLSDTNAYPDDLTLLVIPNYYNVGVKLSSGARWFDDIVANNSIKQNGVTYGHEPDFD